jgi:multidrug efflux pump subunit AcrB
VSLAQNRREVVSVVVFGDKRERELRSLAEKVRNDLLSQTGITVVDLAGARPLEVSIEVPQAALRRYGLTLDEIAQKVREASVELPGGGVKTRGGEILVRMAERRDYGSEFASVVVLSRADGSEVRLGDIAEIDDGFRETDQEAFFDGKPAIMVKVFRVGAQTPIAISDTVKEYVEENRPRQPSGVDLAVWSDASEFYADRLDLLMKNAFFGLILVMFVLGAFLELRLAFWVTLGIPISFIGALLILPPLDASINMISLFAFIVTLGLVVDDAIVVGEAVYTQRTRGVGASLSAIRGVREVAVPVFFAVATTIVAFAPMLFVPGPAGKFFRLIPIVVIAVLAISLVESLLILPAHLAHSKGASARGLMGWVHRQQQRFSRRVEWFIEHVYVPLLDRAVRNRYLTLALGVALLVLSGGFVVGGHIKATFLPKVDGDVVVAEVQMPFGTPVEETRQVTRRMIREAHSILEERGGIDRVGRGIFAQVGAVGAMAGGGAPPASVSGGAHTGEVAVFLVPVDDRSFTSTEFTRQWRERIGEVPGVKTLKFHFSTGPAAGAPIDVELSHRDIQVLEAASTRLAQRLSEYAGVYQIDSGFSEGKEQLDFKLKPGARALGISELDVARQLRSAFFGAEAVRQQRGRDELRAYVRLPDRERRSEHDIEQFMVLTPNGGEVPLRQAVEVERGRSYTEIKRREGRRVVNVTADVDGVSANANEVVADLVTNVLPKFRDEYPGLSFSLEGEQRQQVETMASLGDGFKLALIVIFGILAMAFRSYVQPLIIMLVIPFGLVGALIGHVLMGYDLSLMSMMGVVALAGVVVNDSLILIVTANEYRKAGATWMEALIQGGARRFRPILLTSLTTFFGLIPMIVETSVQARFLIPMAISLGFGVLFATGITLLLVPSAYAVAEDAARGVRSFKAWLGGGASTAAATHGE